MCYAKPGPRCSAHVGVELDSAQQQWNKDPNDENFSALKKKELEYDTTPAGQVKLQKQIEEGQDTSGVLITRLEQGKDKRQKALEKMQKSRGGLLPFSRVRRGINDEEDPRGKEILDELEEDSKALRNSFTDEETEALRWYSYGGFESMNAQVLGKAAFNRYKRNSPMHFDSLTGEMEPRFVETIKKNRKHIDDVLARAEKKEEPRTLYRSHIVRGTNVDKYLSKFEEGKTFTFRGYTSTSADPDLMMNHDYQLGDHYERKKDQEKMIIFEISSKSGAPLHNPSSKGGYMVQDDEREVLLAPGSRMRVVGVKKGVTYQSSRDSEDISSKPNKAMFYSKNNRPKKQFTVIQVVEEDEPAVESQAKNNEAA